MVLAAAAAFTGASLQSATGFGFALVLSPALFAVLEPLEAVSTLLVLGLVLNVLVLGDGGTVRWRALAPVLAAALPGLAVGVVAVTLVPKSALQVAVGLAVVGAAAMVWRGDGARRGPPAGAGAPSHRSGLPAGCAAGLASGALTTSLSLSGPPLVLWLRGRGLEPAELRASLAAAFLALNLAGGVLLLAAGGAAAVAEPALLVPLLVLVLTGHLVGARLFRRLAPERFSGLVLALVVAAGLASVAAGLY